MRGAVAGQAGLRDGGLGRSARTLFVASCAAALVGCAGDDTAGPVPDAGAAAPDATSPPATEAGPSGSVTVTGESFLRLANWSFDAPAIDVCIAPHGTTSFRGPLLAALEADGGAGDGGSTLLTSPSVSAYFEVPADRYDVRLVAGGSPGCSAGIGADDTALPQIGEGTFVTLALWGDARPSVDGGLTVATFTDDAQSTGLAVRLINTDPALSPVDFGIGTALSGFQPIFTGVVSGTASSAKSAPSGSALPIDANGYSIGKPLTQATLSLHATGSTSDAVLAPDISAATGSVLTFVLLAPQPGAAGAGDAGEGSAGSLLECVDNAGTIGALASCTVVSR